jgi:hypothetical protein
LVPEAGSAREYANALYLYEADDVQHYIRVLNSLAIEAAAPSSTLALLRAILERD